MIKTIYYDILYRTWLLNTAGWCQSSNRNHRDYCRFRSNQEFRSGIIAENKSTPCSVKGTRKQTTLRSRKPKSNFTSKLHP